MRAPIHRRLLLIGLLWLACLLRWYAPDLVPYTYDDASQIAIAGTIGARQSAPGDLDSRHFPLLSGGTTLGVQRSALHAWVLAGFLRLGGQIEAAVWGIGALGVVAVAMSYRLGTRVGGPRVGLWAAFFMTVNPWLIYHDRRLWAHISTLVSVILLYLAWRVVVDRQLRAALWVFPTLALQTLAHTLGVVQGLAVLGAVLSLPRAWWNRAAGAGLVLAVLLMLPYGWALSTAQPELTNGVVALVRPLDVPAGTADASGGADSGTGSGEAGQQIAQAGLGVELAPRWRNLLRTNHWTLLNQLATGTGYSSTIGQQETEHIWWDLGRRVGMPLMWLLLAVGLLRLGADLLHPLRGTGARLLWLWLLLPLLLLGVQPVRIAFQYWTVLLPVPALIAALGIDSLRGWLAGLLPSRPSLGRTLSLLPVLGALVAGSIGLGSYATVHELMAAGETRPPLRFWRAGVAVAEGAARAAETGEIRFAVSGMDPAFDGEAAAVATLIGNPPYARFVARPDAAGMPPLLLNYARPSLYYWTLDAPEAEATLAQWGERIWTGDPRRGEPPARLYQVPAYGDLGHAATPIEAPPFDVGMQLLAVDFPPVARAQVPQVYTLVWRVLDPAADVRMRDFTAFNHILTADGERVAQVDGLAVLSRDWWPDDVLIQSYTLTLPPGDLVWHAGLYSRMDGGRAYTPEWQDAVQIPLRVEP